MPESPEVKYMIDNLQYIKGKVLEKIVINKNSRYKKYLKRHRLLNRTLPLKIKDIFSVGKRIFIILEDDWFFIVNMGMTGNISTEKDEVHNSLSFIVMDEVDFHMNDTRKFGSFSIEVSGLEDYIYEMGYDPLYDDITFTHFFKQYIFAKLSKQKLATKLLDQKTFAGMGNYLRAEVLYDSKVDPFCPVKKIDKKAWRRIFNSYNKITKESYKNQKKFINHFDFKVYRRRDKKNVKNIKLNGRTLWYDPTRIKYKC